jgi:hypothetical protein
MLRAKSAVFVSDPDAGHTTSRRSHKQQHYQFVDYRAAVASCGVANVPKRYRGKQVSEQACQTEVSLALSLLADLVLQYALNSNSESDANMQAIHALLGFTRSVRGDFGDGCATVSPRMQLRCPELAREATHMGRPDMMAPENVTGTQGAASIALACTVLSAADVALSSQTDMLQGEASIPSKHPQPCRSSSQGAEVEVIQQPITQQPIRFLAANAEPEAALQAACVAFPSIADMAEEKRPSKLQPGTPHGTIAVSDGTMIISAPVSLQESLRKGAFFQHCDKMAIILKHPWREQVCSFRRQLTHLILEGIAYSLDKDRVFTSVLWGLPS